MNGLLDKIFRIDQRAFKKIKHTAEGVLKYEDEMKALTDKQLADKTPYFRHLLKDGKTLDDILPEAFAVAREAARRVLKQFPFPVQVIGATVLHEGDVAEMRTGEGKTLTATMAVYLNALDGKGVHVVTVNEYLASRDADWMGQIYRFLGLTVGVNLREKDTRGKQEAYNCDITYTTNSELGFDYLRDNMATRTQDRVLRGLSYCVIDEADSILIDESRTPLIISGGAGHSASTYVIADRFVKSLRKEKDFTIDIKKKSCALTDSGIKAAERAFALKNIYDAEYGDLVHRIQQALRANFIMRKDTEYMVSNDEIALIDQFTGRVLQGREYSDGLQQAIQAKENVTIKPETVTLATITYQNFFRLYDKISGMTGTAKTEEEEFRKIYNMRVICIPTNKPVIRIDDLDSIYGTKKAKLKALVAEVKKRHEIGQPMLIGTISVEMSELVHQLLTKNGLTHEVLNAKNHAREALIIEKAGELGAITIATNMAGRGTDIKIDDEVRALGGLAVLGTERHESRRIDGQLRGRSGRQGDPGYSKFFVSLDDELMVRFGPDKSRLMQFVRNGLEDEAIESKMVSGFITSAQKKIEGANFDTRKSLLDYDDVLRKQREIMYKQRDEILYAESVHNKLEGNYFKRAAEQIAHDSLMEVDQEMVSNGAAIKAAIANKFVPENTINADNFDKLPEEDAAEFLDIFLFKKYEQKRTEWSEDTANYVEKTVVLQMVDRNWTKHIDMMSKLREGIYLRSYAQSNPLQAYTNEGFTMFEDMVSTIANEIVVYLLNAQVQMTPKAIPEPQAIPEPLGTNEAEAEVATKQNGEKLVAEEMKHELPTSSKDELKETTKEAKTASKKSDNDKTEPVKKAAPKAKKVADKSVEGSTTKAEK